MTKRSDTHSIFIFLVLVINVKMLTWAVYLLSTINVKILFNKIKMMKLSSNFNLK